MRTLIACCFLFAITGCTRTMVAQSKFQHIKNTSRSGANHLKILQLLADAHVEISLQRWPSAISKSRNILELLSNPRNSDDLMAMEAYVVQVKAFAESGEYEQAVISARTLDRILKTKTAQEYYGIYRILETLGDMYADLGHAEYANRLHADAYTIAKEQNPTNHLDVRKLEFSLKKATLDMSSISRLMDDIEEELGRCASDNVTHNCIWWSGNHGVDRRGLMANLGALRVIFPEYLSRITDADKRDRRLSEYINILEGKAASSTGSSRAQLHCLIGKLHLKDKRITQARKSFSRCREEIEDLKSAIHSSQATSVDRFSIRAIANSLNAYIDSRLSNLAMLDGDLNTAMRLREASIRMALPEIDRRDLSVGHYLRVFHDVNQLAQIYWLHGWEGVARIAWSDAIDIAEEQFRRLGRFETESVLLGKIAGLREISHTIINTLYMESDAERRGRLGDLALASTLLAQARVADALNEQLAPFSGPKTQAEQKLIRNLRSLRFRMATLESEESHPERGPQAGVQLAGLRQNLEQMEAQFRQLTGRAPMQLPLSRQIVAAVAKRMPEDAALIDYVRFRLNDPRIPDQEQKERYRYVALVLRSGVRVTALDLGDAPEIDRIVRDLHEDLENARPDYDVQARRAYDLLMRPLLPALTDVDKLYLVPDADLHLLPFAVLSDGTEPLRSRFQISYLSSGRDLLRGNKQASTGTVVVFANPDHWARMDADGQVLMASSDDSEPTEDVLSEFERTRGLHQRRSPTRSAIASVRGLRDLPGADAEAQAIARLLPYSIVHRREDASERALFSINPVPTILHFATHGRFFENETDSSPLLQQHRGPRIDPEGEEPNPLLRSALVLAGAAHGRVHPESPYDGLATALEISTGLALQGTKLVVLAACETARGVVLQGEGVAGLRRAFLVAGAESVVASLWKVDDSVTKLLMTHFYRLLRAGRPRSEALTTASTIVRSRPEYAHPYYWAGFVLVGQDGPIDNLKD